MAGWPSLGIFTHILIVVAQVPPEEHDGPSGWLCGAWESKALLIALVSGQRRGRAGPAGGTPANHCPSTRRGTYAVRTCSPYSRKGPQGWFLQLHHLEVGNRGNGKGSSLHT